MNKIIEQIEKETWAEVAKLGTVRWSDWRDKFAELIIQQCIDIVAEQSARRPEYRIKQHFGVEE